MGCLAPQRPQNTSRSFTFVPHRLQKGIFSVSIVTYVIILPRVPIKWAAGVIGCGEMRFTLFSALLAALLAAPYARAAKPLEIFFIDVEGGQATLIVSPSGQALLVDTGWRGFNGRDAERIAKACKNGHAKELNYVLITHYHRDHVGGVQQLADHMKIGTFVDHGPNLEDSKVSKEDYTDYEAMFAKAQHLVVKPGDQVPLKGVTVQVLEAAGNHIPAA